MIGRPFYRWPPEFLVSVLLFTSCSVRTEVYEPIQWSPWNPKFIFTSEQFENGVAYYRMSVLLLSKINFVCPNPTTGFGTMTNSIAVQELNENLWIVDKSSFDSCDIDPLKKGNKLLLQCMWKVYSSNTLQHKQIVFAQYSPIEGGLEFEPGKEYYFIATSNGLASSINNTSGGHCRDKKKGVSMRVVFYICRNTSECHSNTTDTTPGTNETGTTPAATTYITPVAAVRKSPPSETLTYLAIAFGVAFGCSFLVNVILLVCCLHKSSRTNRRDEEYGSQLAKLLPKDPPPPVAESQMMASSLTHRQDEEDGSQFSKLLPKDPPPSVTESRMIASSPTRRQGEEDGSQLSKPELKGPTPSIAESQTEASPLTNRQDEEDGNQPAKSKPRGQPPPIPKTREKASSLSNKQDEKDNSQPAKSEPKGQPVPKSRGDASSRINRRDKENGSQAAKPKPKGPLPPIPKSRGDASSRINQRDKENSSHTSKSKPKGPPPSAPKNRKQAPTFPTAARA